ncbi:MAG: DEAD/DEAH box helicase family protein [Polyangiaceae bacterium]
MRPAPAPAPLPSALPSPAEITLRFDRGTLLLEGLPRCTAALHEAGVVWDPRSARFRAPPHRHRAVVAALEAEALPFTDRALGTWTSRPVDWSPVDLRPYQRAALTAWLAAQGRGLAVMPTGSGKTRLALAAMAHLRLPTLCLVPTLVLLHQWRSEIARFYGGKVGVWGDGLRDLAPVMVMTFESAYRHMARVGHRFELLVVDEAHHFGQGARDELLEMAIAHHRLGLTATPSPLPDAAAELRRLLGPTVFRTELADLAGTYLADFDLHVLHLPLDPDERAEYDTVRRIFGSWYAVFRRAAPGAEWKDVVAAAQTSHEGRAALRCWRRSRELVAFTRAKATTLDALLAEHRGSRILVFTGDNATAYAIARRNLVMPLTCDIGRQERAATLERFARGELRGLVSSRVLNEGLDVPEADVGIIVGGTRGGTGEHVQRIGRLLRPAPGKRATVYELIADGTVEVRQGEERRRGLVERAGGASGWLR